MQTRPLGNSGLEFTTVGIGTWAIGGGNWRFGWGQQDDNEAVAACVRGVECGCNWIDTAAVYGDGHSEVLVGRALKELGAAKQPLVATKCGRIILEDGSIIARITADSVRAECEASLQRLGIDCIDLYQMHWPEPDEDIEEGWAEMVRLKEEGKVRHNGVSNFNVEQLKRAHAIHPIASLQPPYSMIVRGIEDDILPFCGENNIGVICYSPMCKGLLTGTFTKERAAQLSDTDHRSRDPKFADPQLSINLALVEGLQPIAARNNRSLPELAIAWTLCRSEMTSAIVGARRPSQIEQTASAGDWQLSEVDQAEIAQLLDAHQQSMAALGNLSTGRV